MFFACLIFSSCEIINPDEEIPSYLHIDSISLITDYPTHGTASHRITDAWVYIDNNLVGVFELPVTIPILAEGEHDLILKGGILINGNSETRAAYPFYSSHTQKINLKKESVVTLNPSITYYSSGITFSWKEDFESAGITLQKVAKSDTDIVIVQDSLKVFEGKKSAAFILPAGKTFFECTSTGKFQLTAGRQNYLEMNFNSNHEFVLGLWVNSTSQSTQQVIGTVYPSSGWKKIYVDLSSVVDANSSAIDFQFFIGMLKTDSGVNAEVYVDNIKLIHN